MSWNGILFGAMIGFLLTRSAWGAVAGAIIGYMLVPKAGIRFAAPNGAASISSEFFRTTFEIMGHVAKSDGRVCEAEIDAARFFVRLRTEDKSDGAMRGNFLQDAGRAVQLADAGVAAHLQVLIERFQLRAA